MTINERLAELGESWGVPPIQRLNLCRASQRWVVLRWLYGIDLRRKWNERPRTGRSMSALVIRLPTENRFSDE
jgi:hypothetical protein